MFLTVDKLEKRAEELETFRYRDMVSLLPMIAHDDPLDSDAVHTGIPPELEDGRESVVRQGDYFVGRDQYLWLRKRADVPPPRPGHRVYGRFDFGRTGHGNTSGFEALLYVDGHPYQGVDANHPDVCLDRLAGRQAELTFMLWSGLEGGGAPQEQIHMIRCAQLGYLHTDTDELYQYARVICEAVRLMPEESTDRQTLIRSMDRALLCINWDEDRFYDTVGDALSCLREALAKHPKLSDITVHCVGHTHIDVAWLWRLKHTREKGIRSFSTVLRLMDEFDDYIFLQSQPQLYRYLKTDCPELYARIRERIREGRWEADGGMWLEADCNISSGESLVRQFLHGIRFLREEFGCTCTYLWLPDVFGYSWALPQIMRQCGLKTFMTTKISWNQYNSMPNDLFRWRGIDGTEVLTYFITTPEVGHDFDCRFSTYNGLVSPRTVLGSWKKFRNKDITRDILIAYGYGDGGGGVTRDMLRMRRVMDELPGLPHVVNDRAGDFFEKIHQDTAQTDGYVPVWDGELYLEYHRGTYTSQAANKKWNRRMENRLAEAEWLCTLALLAGGGYPQRELYGVWETVLRNQFHDIIPGSSIAEVYEDSRKEYQQADAQLDRLRAQALDRLGEPDADAVLAVNPAAFAQTGLLRVDEEADGVFADAAGNLLPAQKTAGGYQVLATLPALSVQTLTFKKTKRTADSSPFRADMAGRRLETPFYLLSWNADGQLDRLYDKQNRREVVPHNGLANVLEVYEDKPLNFDAWDIDLFHIQKKEVLSARSVALTENGPLYAVIRFTYVYSRSLIIQDMIVYAHSRRIDFRTSVDWHADHRLLKVSFDTTVRSTRATYDIQFGHVERPTHFNTSWDYARFEVVGHKWADLSDSRYGVSLLNDCKYGYSIRDNVMKLSLLKSSTYPNPQADRGSHEFTYALLPHAGNVTEGDTIEESAALNRPLEAERGIRLRDDRRIVCCDTPGVEVDAVKRCEDDGTLIVRMHECRGAQTAFRLTSEFAVRSWTVCSPLEEPLEEENSGAVIEGCLHPFELRTYRIRIDP